MFLEGQADVNRQVLPVSAGVLTVPYRRAVGGWRLSESKLHFAPAETERIPAAGYKAGPADQPFRRQNSVREHVLVIGHGVLVKRFASVGLLGGWRRQAGGGIVPGAEVAEDLLDDAGFVNDGDDAHGVPADGAAQRVNMPDAQNQVPPFI